MWKARRYHVPFRKKVWYNWMVYTLKEERNSTDGIVVFDKDGCYISCPKIGGVVKYRCKGDLYSYRVVGFDNDSPYKDWLFESDRIYPIIEFISKVE